LYELWYGISSIVLGALLFIPMRKIIYAMTYNRFVAKKKKQPTDAEAQKMQKRCNIIAAIASITFAFLFNKFMMFKYFGSSGR
jgi:hypothetical protein